MEEGLDRGDIVIVPVSPNEPGEDARWKCVLVNESIREKTLYHGVLSISKAFNDHVH